MLGTTSSEIDRSRPRVLQDSWQTLMHAKMELDNDSSIVEGLNGNEVKFLLSQRELGPP